MATYKTPGVYTEEISKFPPSVAEVATAIPAFIGYTEKAEQYGENVTNVPVRLKSLLEYGDVFGGDYVPTAYNVTVDDANNYAVRIGVQGRMDAASRKETLRRSNRRH